MRFCKGERFMKRTTLALAALALAFSGCNTCGTWRPNLLGKFKSCLHGASNIGAPCDAGCETGAPAGGPDGCTNCGETSANYGGYGETVIGSYETPISAGSSDGITIGSPISGSSLPAGSTIPSGSVLPSTSGAYSGTPTPANTIRPETIRPKPAN